MKKTEVGDWSKVLSPIKAQETISDQVYNSILGSILSGQIGQGQHLVEQVLADQLSVSRISVREAIRRLARDELVQIISNRGAFVVTFGVDDVEEIFNLRSALEAIAIERVTSFASDQSLTVFDDILNEMVQYEKNQDRIRGAAADTNFHRKIMELSGQPRIFQVWERMSAQITVVLYNVSNYYPSYFGLADRHVRIVELIRARDPQPAGEHLKDHIMEGAQRLLQAMRETS
ncbi:MAG: GntR family transcriptional regulator [Anaerolineae bacterium]|nr:GntR family transcriptional regulator [Anaerolineae bacterium]